MTWIKDNIVALMLGAAAGAIAVLLSLPTQAAAADLGGNCCADLEERIAELEATTARKGNRKVSLRVYGQISKALMHISGDGDAETFVIENSNAETFVGFAGEGRISSDWKAGYVLEIGAGGYGEDGELGLIGGAADDANNTFVRRSFVYMEHANLGKLAIGRNSQATDEISQISVANTQVAARMLSLRPLIGPEAGEVADLFDGARTEIVRYDSPVLNGLLVSASWAHGDLDSGAVWDVALRYAGEFSGFRVGAGIGYKRGIVVPDVTDIGSVFGADIETISGSASVMHVTSGMFLNGAYGRVDVGPVDLTGWHLQGGAEQRWNSLGKTTVFAEYAKTGADLDGIKVYGFGLVQNLEGAAFDLFGNVRRIDLGGDDATTIMVGARASF